MGYNKLIQCSDLIELYEYENNIEHFGRKGKAIPSTYRDESLRDSRADVIEQGEQKNPRRKDNAQRASMAFRRIVSSNLGESNHPLLVTLTYAKSEVEIGLSRAHFNTFARSLRAQFGQHIRYIAVAEFQKRGTIHYHALFWGLPSEKLCRTERSTRMVAGLWKHGFIDLKLTDGNHKIAGYLAKYMQKTFSDIRLAGYKAYIASRNIKRPIVMSNILLSPLFYGGLQDIPDLSTAELLYETEYMTKWLGKGRYRNFKIKK